ncbi:hypothetical protein BD410DRAFT_137360 [Rickenella mellea]|uniref:Uncharacterized protein n=1 Tax=Rickenella mellea TaxID=50990 RepID=A0A4Y7PI51_9AGAM|nr:hypothetical protein BD410DRAFT_137360 [Rickenella mellea]
MTQLSSSLNATGGDSVDNEHSTWRRDCVEVTNGLRIYRRVTEPSQRPAIDQLRQYFDQRGRTTASEATDCDDFSIVTRASLEKNGFPENYFSQIAQEAPAHRGTITTKNSPVRKDGSAGRQATEPQASDKLVNPARSGPSEVPENHDFGDSGVQNQWTEQPNLPDDFFTDQSNGGAEARIGWPTEFQVQPMPGRYGQSGEPLTYRNAPSPLSHADNAEPRLATFSFGFIAPHPLQYRQQAPNHGMSFSDLPNDDNEKLPYAFSLSR